MLSQIDLNLFISSDFAYESTNFENDQIVLKFLNSIFKLVPKFNLFDIYAIIQYMAQKSISDSISFNQ